MSNSPFKVKFKNKSNPKSVFDIVPLEKILKRSNLDHNPEELHKVDFYLLLFITSGSGSHTIDFTDYRFQKGTILTIRRDQIQKFIRGNGATGFLLLFTEDFLLSYLEAAEVQKSLQLFNEYLFNPKLFIHDVNFEDISSNIERLKQEYESESDNYSSQIIRSELHILLIKLLRLKTNSNEEVKNKFHLKLFLDFQDLILNDASKTTRVIEYAKILNTSPKTLNTATQSILNKTAKKLVDDIGIQHIKRLLINTPLSVKEIAYQSGFDDTNYLYKYFRRQVKMTPEEFRASF
ncbi:MAG: AraC family transcriptional regulator [Flavobacteriales bacterium]|nr:AraC family transcriptional regulator [Flavobacteriales bacterium]